MKKFRVEARAKAMAVRITRRFLKAYIYRRYATGKGVELQFYPHAWWLLKDQRILKLPKNAYLLWHIDNFDNIFHSFENSGVIDLEVPSFLTMKSNQKQIFLFQTPEDDHVAKGYLAINKPGNGDIVFDVGANCGVMSNIYSSLCTRVIAFEPNPYSHAALCTNVVHLGLKNVIPLMVGLWSESGYVDLTVGLGGGDMILTTPLWTSTTKAKVVNLEDAVVLTGCLPTHIKMDIERAELEVIKGNLDFISRNDFKFAIACYHVVNGAQTSQALIDMFQSIGYKTELAYPGHLTLHAWRE